MTQPDGKQLRPAYLNQLIAISVILTGLLIIFVSYFIYADYRFKADKKAVYESAARLIESGRRRELVNELKLMGERSGSNESGYRKALEALEKKGAE